MPKKSKKTNSKVSLDAVRMAASGRWREILQVIGGIPSSSLDGRHHPCPRCGGSDRFRLIDPDAGAVLCNQCFASQNGDGFAAVQHFRDIDFLAAAKEIADHLGIEFEGASKSRPKLATEQLTFRPWSDVLAAQWCLKKTPITIDALKAAGARIATYYRDYTVIAIPVWGKECVDSTKFDPSQSEPIGWVLYNKTGTTLPVFENGEITNWVKVKTLAGTRPGLMGRILPPESGLTIKTEGPSDMLGLLSHSIDSKESIVCNVNGCQENPRNTHWFADFFSGRDVATIGDNDRPGQSGAINWARYAAVSARASRVVALPGTITDTHGSDLRDYFKEHSRDDLNELINKAEQVQPEEGTRANEAIDDPYRLARLNLEKYATKTNGRTLRYWNDSWWAWKHQAYRTMGEGELKAKITASIKEEFDRINIQEQKSFQERKEAGLIDADEKPPIAKKVTPQLVASVLGATKGMLILSGECQLDTWIPDRSRRNYISMQNGLLNIDAILANKETNETLLPHSPEWFSTVHLKYDFDPTAQCPKWNAFLEKNLENDSDRIGFLQEWAGYLLLPDTGEQKFLLLEGEGANGKSVFCAAMEALLGPSNCSHVQLEMFGDRFSKTQTLGKLVNICGDAPEMDAVAEGTLKAFTSGNPMLFDRKGTPGIMATPTARLMIACNNLPRFRDRSQGIWRRAMIVPWRVTISENERVRNMDKADFWIQSGELPGIFRWAVLGLARLKENGGFTKSQVMQARKEEYQLEANPTKSFLVEYLEENSSSYPVRSSFLYSLYRKWASESGFYPLSSTQFGKEILRQFPSIQRTKRGPRLDRSYCYTGIAYQDGVISSEEWSNAYIEHDVF